MRFQQILALLAFLVAGWTIASLSLSGNILEGSAPINIGLIIQTLSASAGDIVLTAMTGFLGVVLYLIVRDHRYLPDAVRNLLFGRKDRTQSRSRWQYGGAIIGVLLLVGFLLAAPPTGLFPISLFPQQGGEVGGPSPPGNPILNGPNPASSLTELYRFFLQVAFQIFFLLILGLSAAILLVGIVRRGGPLPPLGMEDSPVAAETVKAIREGVRRLELGGDYRDSILRCYRQLCSIFDRYVSMGHLLLTARELQRAMATNLNIPGAPVSRLTNLFEEARYSPHPITKEMRDHAVESLREIESILGDHSASIPSSIQ